MDVNIMQGVPDSTESGCRFVRRNSVAVTNAMNMVVQNLPAQEPISGAIMSRTMLITLDMERLPGWIGLHRQAWPVHL